jgi:UDP-2-acetamido-3-amino-2,3-dideoxy-glucuronate N-acetyltransferase
LQRIPVAAKAEAEVVPLDLREPLKAECQHFIDCVVNGNTPETDGSEGLRVLQVLQALQESLNRGGCKITTGRDLEGKATAQKRISSDSSVSYELRPENHLAHESCYVDENVEIGKDTKIWHFSHILSGSRIGERCNIGQNVVIGPDVAIGNGCKIQNNVSIYKGVTLEDEVFCGPSMVFTNVYNPRSAIRRMDEIRYTLVKRGATIGANATVMCGITIGSYAFIGSGAVVLKNVPDYALVVGNPGEQKGWMCACGVQLSFNEDRAICGGCDKAYQKIGTDRIIEVKEEERL